MTGHRLFRSFYGATKLSLCPTELIEQHSSCVHLPRVFLRQIHLHVQQPAYCWPITSPPITTSYPINSHQRTTDLLRGSFPLLFSQQICSRFISSRTFPLVTQQHYYSKNGGGGGGGWLDRDIDLGSAVLGRVMEGRRSQVNSEWRENRHVCHCWCQQRRTYAKKAKKTLQKLSEEEQDVIDLEKVSSSMEAAINALKYEYTNSIITRITPASLDKVSVEIEGEWFQLKQVAQIGMPNPQTIIVNISTYPQAAESFMAALREADLNLNPILEKNVIKVPIPKMTNELRENLVKVAKAAAEKCKVGVRKARQKAMADLKKKSAVSKDSVRKLEKHIQELTDQHNARIEELFKAKSTELLKGG